MPNTESPEKLVETIVPVDEFIESNDSINDAATLRCRLKETGYLFFRGVLNVDGLMQVRRDILSLCHDHGWLSPTAPLMDGVYSQIPFPDYYQEYMPMYRKLIRLESFNQYSRSPEIMNLVTSLLGGEILAHPRTISRVTFPKHVAFTTQPHQDFYYIRGTPETYTAWIPVGDCSRKLGGLALLENSNRLGFLKHEPAVGAGGNGIRTAKLGLRWLASDFQAGDYLLFHSYTIHGALENQTPDRLRISMDFRYQLASDEVNPKSLIPHLG